MFYFRTLFVIKNKNKNKKKKKKKKKMTRTRSMGKNIKSYATIPVSTFPGKGREAFGKKSNYFG